MGVTSVEGFRQAGFSIPQPTGKANTEQAEKEQTTSKENDTGMHKVLAATLFGSGAILFYLGLKKPAYGGKIKHLYQEKSTYFTRSILKFEEDTEQIFKECYKGLNPYFTFLKNTKIYNAQPALTKILKAKTNSEIFDVLDKESAKIRELRALRSTRERAHLSDMDEARQYIYTTNSYAYGAAAEQQNKVSTDMLTNSLMPRFSDGKFESSLTEYEKKLADKQRAADEKMREVLNNISDEHIKTFAGTAAEFISRGRIGNLKSEQNIMQTAYTRAAQLLGLDTSFQPLFITGKTVTAFKQLAPNSLLPKRVSESTGKIITEPYVKYILEHVNFKKLSGQTIRELFNRMPDGFNIKQLDLITDRLRLQQAADFAKKETENKELTSVIAKLEYLSVELEECGKSELFAKINRNFTGLTDDELKAKLYYLHNTAKRLGMFDIEDVDKYLAKNIKNYEQTSFKQIVEKARTNPDKFYV